MKIIIVGDGKVGITLTEFLSQEGHDIMVIDRNPKVIDNVVNTFDIMGISGNGANYDTLIEAGAERADLLIAATSSDELNILSCLMAKKIGTKNTIARVRNPEYAQQLRFIREELGLSMVVNPEFEAARDISRISRFPSAIALECFSKGRVELAEIKLPENGYLAGHKLSELHKVCKEKVLVCAVQRGEEAYIPHGNFTLLAGDKIGVTGSVNEILHFFNELGIKRTAIKKVMILGASKTAVYLAKKLCQIGNSVTIIDKDRQKCEEISAELPKALVVNGDGSSQELLIEEGISNIDAVVSLTGLDELNILISSYASSKNVPKVITKINRQELIPLAEHWGLDTVVSPRKTISNIVVGYARALENSKDSSVETLYKLMDDKVEALEFTVKDGLDFLNVAFKELKLKENILIAGIIRDRKTIIPSGEDVLLSGDKVVILAANQRINNLSDIIR